MIIKFIAVSVCLYLIVIYFYILSFHRLKTFQDFSKVLEIAANSYDDSDKRCKVHNSSHFNCLPNVFFIGASKCGTTSMSEYLAQHPRIKFVKRRINPSDHHREVHRFDRNTYENSIKTIELLEEFSSSPEITNKNDKIIHYTPHYFYAPSVPFELSSFIPNPSGLKFIVMLRDPTDRAWSSYWFHNSYIMQNGIDKGSIKDFENDIMFEIGKRKIYDNCISNVFENSFKISSDEYMRTLKLCFKNDFRSSSLGKRHLDKGIYFDQFHRWFHNFSKSQFHIIFYENFKADPVNEFKILMKFLFDEDSSEENDFLNHINFNISRLVNPNSKSKNISFPNNLRVLLNDFYNPYNRQLSNLLNIKVLY